MRLGELIDVLKEAAGDESSWVGDEATILKNRHKEVGVMLRRPAPPWGAVPYRIALVHDDDDHVYLDVE